MQKTWEWAEERLTTEEIRNEMLLRTEREGRNAWHIAAFGGKTRYISENMGVCKIDTNNRGDKK